MKYLKTGWGEMAYTDSGGTSIPLLFLHGTGCDSTDWTSVCEYLPQIQRYITLDFRGHGKSTVPTQQFTITNLAEDVIHLIKTIGIQEVILVGHSLGGMVATDVTKRCSMVNRIILLEGWTNLRSAGTAFDSGRFYGTLQSSEILRIQRIAEETRNRFIPTVWEYFWNSVIEFDALNFLENASIPIYEVFGEIGRNYSTEQILNIPSNPNIQVIWLPNAGHYIPHERPEQVAEICLYFKN